MRRNFSIYLDLRFRERVILPVGKDGRPRRRTIVIDALPFCVQELGEDLWLFATDWPHGDTAWPESLDQVVNRPELTERAKRKILGENALRLCPCLRA